MRRDRLHFAHLFHGGNKNHACAGVFQKIERLVRSEGGVYGDIDDAAVNAGKISNHPFRAVLAQDGHAIALLESPLLQDAGQAGHVSIELAGGNDLPCGAALEHDVALHVMLNRSKKDVDQGPDFHTYEPVSTPLRTIATTESVRLER